jgi:hypothetical protein
MLHGSLGSVPADDRRQIKSRIRELRWLIRSAERIARLLFSEDEERRRFLCLDGSIPLRYFEVQKHGAWRLFYEQSSARYLSPQFRSLQVHALLAQASIVRFWFRENDSDQTSKLREDTFNRMYRWTLKIRHFNQLPYRSSKEYLGTLARIPVGTSRPDLMAAIRRLRPDRSGSSTELEESLAHDLGSIHCLLRVADDPKALISISESEEDEFEEEILEDPAPPTVEPEQDGDYAFDVDCLSPGSEEDDEQQPGENEDAGNEEDDGDGRAGSTGVTYERHKWDEIALKNCLESGIHPTEILLIQKLHLSTRRSGDPRSWQAMRNQELPYGKDYLTLQEAAAVLQILERKAQRGPADLELYTLAKAVTVRGLTLSTATSIVTYSERPPDEQVKTLSLLISPEVEQLPEWLLPAVPIPYESEHGAYLGCNEVKKAFVFPDYCSIGALVRQVILFKFPTWQGESVQPFSEPIDFQEPPSASYPQRLQQILEAEDVVRGSSLARFVTFPKLGRILHRAIYEQTSGNLVQTTYVTLKADHVGEVGRYYATPSIQSVQRTDIKAITSITEELGRIGYDAAANLDLVPSDSSGYLGSPMCPTLENIKKFFDDQVAVMKKANQTLKGCRENVQAIIERHDAYTMLTFCAVTIGTCHRPSHGGIPDLGEIDRSGFVGIVDKGNLSARLGVAADIAIAQLKGQNEYMEKFPFERYFGSKPPLKFFFLGPNGEYSIVSQASLKQHGLPFVANFARHIVKTTLDDWALAGDERLCPEWISALLGHFADGEEPFGSHSTFNYRLFFKSINSALNDLLKCIQFMPINILGQKLAVFDAHLRRFLPG